MLCCGTRLFHAFLRLAAQRKVMVIRMKNLKIMLLGLGLMLFGVCAVLMSGLKGFPTYDNGFYQLLGVVCPFAGLALCLFGCARKDQ